MKAKYIVTALSILFVLQSYGQVDQPNCVGYNAAIYQNTVSNLSADNQKLLLNKVDQIIARNSAGKTALYNAFSIVAEFGITAEEMAETGMQNLYLFKGELTLFAINDIDKSRYGSVIVNLTGSGKSKEAAQKSLLQSIKATDAVYAKFIKNSTEKIIEYFNNNLSVVITKAETLIAQEKYDDANKVLMSIPECVPAYLQSAEAIKGLSAIVFEKSCQSALEMAQRAYDLKQYKEARELLSKVKPASVCSEKAMELAKLIGEIEPKTEVAPVVTSIAATQLTPAQTTPQAANASPSYVSDANGILGESGFNGIKFVLVKCIGNKNDQTVRIEYTVLHEKINQEFTLYSAEIFLPDGEKVWGNSFGNQKVPTGVTVKLGNYFKGVLPTVKTIPLIAITLNRYDAKNSDRQVVNFRNIPIQWN